MIEASTSNKKPNPTFVVFKMTTKWSTAVASLTQLTVDGGLLGFVIRRFFRIRVPSVPFSRVVVNRLGFVQAKDCAEKQSAVHHVERAADEFIISSM
jgi:hypothetical protein